MEDRHISIKALAMECHWPVTRRYAWGLGIVLTISGFMTFFTIGKDRKVRKPRSNKPCELTVHHRDIPSNLLLTLPNGDLFDVSTPLTIYTSLFTPQEAIRKSICLPDLEDSDSAVGDGELRDQALRALHLNDVGDVRKCEQKEEERYVAANAVCKGNEESEVLVDMENRIKASNLIGKIEADMKGPRKRGFRDDADAGRIDAGVCGNKREIGNPHQAMAQSDAVEHETKIVRTRPPLGGIKQRMSVVLRTAFQSKCRAPYLLCRTGIRSKCRALNSLRKAGARKEVVLLVCLSGLAMATCLLTSLSSSSSSRTKSSPYSFHNLYPMPLAPVRYFI